MDTLASLSEKITSAEIAQKKWRETSLNARIEFLMCVQKQIHEHKNDFVNLLISEILKPKKYAVDEVERTLDMILAFCAASNAVGEVREGEGKIAIIKRQPLGTVLCISPFNYPLNEAMAKIVPALLMGNSVLFKPASCGWEVGKLISDLFDKSNFPEGVFSLIDIRRGRPPGRPQVPLSRDIGQTGRSVPTDLYDYVVSHPLIECINFTGSTATAEHIAKLCGIKKLIFGLSGKDASIVLNDADIKLAAREIVAGAFSYSGQRCTGIKRVFVQESIYDSFLSNVKSQMLNVLCAGDLDDEKTNFGPVISESHADFINELLDDAKNLGAEVIPILLQTTDYRLQTNKWGKLFIPPTIITGVSQDMRLAWEEPFGPILPVVKFKTVDEAVKLCNKSSFGLQNSVFTRDINVAFSVADQLECGVVQINGKDARGPDNFPFLGVKKSGLGVVGGIKYLLEEMSTIKSVVINFFST